MYAYNIMNDCEKKDRVLVCSIAWRGIFPQIGTSTTETSWQQETPPDIVYDMDLIKGNMGLTLIDRLES